MHLPPYPQWVLDKPPGTLRDIAEHRFLVLLLNLYSGPYSDLHRVARELDINPRTLQSRISKDRGSPIQPRDREQIARLYHQYVGVYA